MGNIELSMRQRSAWVGEGPDRESTGKDAFNSTVLEGNKDSQVRV